MPAPKKQPVKQPVSPIGGTLAQSKPAPPTLLKTAQQISAEHKILPPVDFSLFSGQSPYHLPLSCGQILFKHQLLDQNGKIIFKNLGKLNNQSFNSKIKARLTFAISKSHFRSDLKHLLQAAHQLTKSPPALDQSLNAFASLLSNYYSHYPAITYLTNLYPSLLSSQTPSFKPSQTTALKQAKQSLVKQLNQDKTGIAHSATLFYQHPSASLAQKKAKQLGLQFTSQLLSLLDQVQFNLPHFSFKLQRSSFPNITLVHQVNTDLT